MLQDPTQLIVPVSEPVGILRAQGNIARAYSLDRQTLDVTGAVFAFRDGLAGINYQFIDYDPPPTDVLAASTLQRKVYGIASGASGEELVIIPTLPPVVGSNPPPPTMVPLWGADATGTPLALTYRTQDAKLYLLDRVEQHGRSARLRLLRITPAGGYATPLRSMPDFRARSVYLSATARGDLLLAKSKEPGSTLFMTLRPTKDGVELAGWLVQQGTLLAPPDARTLPGFSVVMRHRPKGPIHALEIPWSYLATPGKAGELPREWE